MLNTKMMCLIFPLEVAEISASTLRKFIPKQMLVCTIIHTSNRVLIRAKEHREALKK
jgi:hypothetical protein